MLTFCLYHTLHLQYYELLKTVGNGFEICGLYGLSQNKIIFESIDKKALGFSFETGALEECPSEEAEELSAKGLNRSEVKMETETAEVFKFLFTVLRRSFKIEPCAEDYMLHALCKKLNQKLVRYNCHCFLETGDIASLSAADDKDVISLENLVERLSEEQRHLSVSNEVYEDYLNGQKERKFCRFAEAEAYFEKVLSAEKKGSILYQETCFEMGEVFYFTERLKEAIQCYHSCNPKLLNKGEELFLRLGYCLAEMKKTSEPVRFYTKCRLNGRYMAANKDLLPSEEIPVEEFEEYSKLCEALGEADWKQNVIKI